MTFAKRVMIIFVSIIVLFSLVGCGKGSSIATFSDVEEMFVTYATLKNGTYVFDKFDSVGNVGFSYSFSYDIQSKRITCCAMAITYGSIDLIDFASVSFTWGNFKRGYFYADHELRNIAVVSFEYKNIVFNDNGSLGNSYDYVVTKNTFVNLTEKDDIDGYSANSYLCLCEAVRYCRTVLISYGLSANLW